MLKAKSSILYVRAALRPSARSIRKVGGIVPFLSQHIDFDELIAPNFTSARPFWRSKKEHQEKGITSGALGKKIASLPNAINSDHPTHAFSGFGPQVTEVLKKHGRKSSCFAPIDTLSSGPDFSMLLWGCVEQSPGFSTIHASQFNLGLTQKHLIRHIQRWDSYEGEKIHSAPALESPGCSLSFGKFYPHYIKDDNFIEGEWDGVRWVFIKSARRAMAVETNILQENGRFVKCERKVCPTCTFRLY